MDLHIPRVNGGVLTCENVDVEAMVAMLSNRVQSLVQYTYLRHPGELPGQHGYELLIVARIKDLHNTIEQYHAHHFQPPVIVHLINDTEAERINYREHYPGVKIIPIRQARLEKEPDITLQFSSFEEVITRIFARKTAAT